MARFDMIENYYRASNALMSIGTDDESTDELKKICIKASVETVKIIDYINTHQEEFK